MLASRILERNKNLSLVQGGTRREVPNKTSETSIWTPEVLQECQASKCVSVCVQVCVRVWCECVCDCN